MTTRIMVADDSLFARMLAKEAVSNIFSDAEFMEAASGADALAMAEADAYQLDWYLLDINMGGPNGVDTAKALIAAGVAAHKIALVTGNRSKDLQDDAEAAGLTYILKTISPNDVDQFIERLRQFFTSP
ncbi:response regulator [Thalassolituus marinus]|uniref:Response regulator n=1 Tax=Thalassolituus marinus TaxID=671053 RepID=A0ABS7ZPE4_9GAMM|nr:response regulator [Thalassolituus marinus]MCA6063568.1 response regulator [Thalassolituus marinus]